MKFKNLILLSFLFSSTAVAQIAPNAKIFIAPMDHDLHTQLKEELAKQKVPVVVVTSERRADYVMRAETTTQNPKWYHSFKGGKDKYVARVTVVNRKTKKTVWTSKAGSRSMWTAGLKQGDLSTVAERIAKKLKKDVEKNGNHKAAGLYLDRSFAAA